MSAASTCLMDIFRGPPGEPVCNVQGATLSLAPSRMPFSREEDNFECQRLGSHRHVDSHDRLGSHRHVDSRDLRYSSAVTPVNTGNEAQAYSSRSRAPVSTMVPSPCM